MLTRPLSVVDDGETGMKDVPSAVARSGSERKDPGGGLNPRQREIFSRRRSLIDRADAWALNILEQDLRRLVARQRLARGVDTIAPDRVILDRWPGNSAHLPNGKRHILAVALKERQQEVIARWAAGDAISCWGTPVRWDPLDRRPVYDTFCPLPELSASPLKVRPPPKVTVVTLHYNSLASTELLLKSLSELTYPWVEIMVLDNDSRDGLVEKYHSGFERFFPGLPPVHLFRSDQNLGFAGGMNKVVEQALRNGTDYVYIINNDIILSPSALEPLVAAGEERPEVGSLGSKVYLKAYLLEGKGHPGGEIFMNAGSCYLKKSRGAHCRDTGQFDTPAVVDFIDAVAVLIKREALEEVGRFDSRFFFGRESMDWSLRARAAGWSALYIPSVGAWHVGAASYPDKDTTLFIEYFRMKANFLGIRKFHGRGRLAFLFRLFLEIQNIIPDLKKKKASRRTLRALWRGVRDGLRGKFVPAPLVAVRQIFPSSLPGKNGGL